MAEARAGLVHVFGFPDDSLAADARVCEGHPERAWEEAAEHGAVRVIYHPTWRSTEPGHARCCRVCGTGSGPARHVRGDT